MQLLLDHRRHSQPYGECLLLPDSLGNFRGALQVGFKRRLAQ